MPDTRSPTRSIDTAGTPAMLLTADEFARYRSELENLRQIRERRMPELLRDARTFVANDAIEEIAQIQEGDAVALARISWLQELLNSATVVADGEALDVATLGRAVEVEYIRSGRVT